MQTSMLHWNKNAIFLLRFSFYYKTVTVKCCSPSSIAVLHRFSCWYSPLYVHCRTKIRIRATRVRIKGKTRDSSKLLSKKGWLYTFDMRMGDVNSRCSN